MSKISLIGAGQIGGTLAHLIGLKELADEISSHIEFNCIYKPDYRQDIANTWPVSIDDKDARNDWGWKPKFDISKMTRVMIDNLRRKK